MSDCKIYPADTVDISGNVWETVGENIRNGIFGENVKAGYVNIDKGNITSTNFIDIDIDKTDKTNFVIQNINCFLAFAESITEGGLNITIANTATFARIRNTISFNNVVATIKIIYKDAL